MTTEQERCGGAVMPDEVRFNLLGGFSDLDTNAEKALTLMLGMRDKWQNRHDARDVLGAIDLVIDELRRLAAKGNG